MNGDVSLVWFGYWYGWWRIPSCHGNMMGAQMQEVVSISEKNKNEVARIAMQTYDKSIAEKRVRKEIEFRKKLYSENKIK